MTPDNYPIEVPAGGSFGFTGTICNTCDYIISTDVWYGVLGFGNYYEQGVLRDIPLDGRECKNGHLIQYVPGYAPQGTYYYAAWSGDYDNWLANDSSAFQFTVSSGLASEGASDWITKGNFIDFEEIPDKFALESVYPNPFNATTNISFGLPKTGQVSLEIYNLMGQKVATLVDDVMVAGYHTVTWDASTYSSGIYFYKLIAGDKSFTRRMTLLK